MKPHPRIRKTVKWGGLVLTVLSLGLWMWSFRGSWGFGLTPAWSIGFGRGCACVCYVRDRFIIGWERAEPNTLHWWYFRWNAMGYTSRYYPMWPAVLAMGVLTILGFRLDSRALQRGPNRCPRCRYDRAGLAPSAVCPECGAGAPGGAAQQ